MRFSGGEMVYHILEIRSKTMNVVEINRKSIRGSVKTPKIVSRGVIQPGNICGPLPRWGLLSCINETLRELGREDTGNHSICSTAYIPISTSPGVFQRAAGVYCLLLQCVKDLPVMIVLNLKLFQ